MLRRSSRARQLPTSTYDDELKHLAEKKNNQSTQDSDSDASDAENEVKEALMEEDQEQDLIDMEAEEEFSPKKKKSPSPQKKSRGSGKSTKQRAIQVQIGGKSKSKGGKTTTKGGTKNKRSIQIALVALAKKVLDPSESPETSLVAALLSAAKPIPEIPSSTPRPSPFASHKVTMYTPQLDGIARKLVQEHEPNSMHIRLLNLLFRSVGGSVATNLKEGADLEELDDNEWDTLVTDVVQVMRESDTELLTANPEDKVGPREYRAIYQEFWYRLGVIILTHIPGSTNNQDGDDCDDPTPQRQVFTSNRFQVELMRELVARVTELVLVGQPDLRAGGTTAVWELAKACMERTVELTAKIATAQRQYAASKGQSRKLEALQHSMDSWKRHKAELEVLVEESVIQGVFIRRYRDSNPHIRCESLEALCRLTLLRPDLFLKDKYLKYLGWMTSDKAAIVRLAALKGLLVPFKYKQDRRPATLQIDLQGMQNVCTKFLPRIADCTEDSQSLDVQQAAMELIVKLMNEGFLDEWDDDEGWDQLNLKALDTKTTPSVRKNALYLILDQLDCFDDGGNDARSVVSTATLSERQQTVRIDGLARWMAHLLCSGPVHVDKIKIELTDNLIESLRSMPEHKSLTTSWTAMLKAIRSDNPQQGGAEKEELAKTRILLRMLAGAAKLEMGPSSDLESAKKRKRDAASSQQPREALSQALLKNLPGLLTAYKTDDMAMRSLTKLPQYLLPEVYCLPTRKSDFAALIKNLCLLYLESTGKEVLQEIAKALAVFVQGNHTRVAEVKMHLKKVSSALQDRLMELFADSDPESQTTTSSKQPNSQRKRSSRRSNQNTVSGESSSVSATTVFSNSRETDIENSICLCLSRWRILLKQIPLSFLFDEFIEADDDENEVEGFCKTVSEALARRLIDRKPVVEEGDDEQTADAKSVAIAPIWKSNDLTIHTEVAKAVDVGLDVLLCVVSWKLHETLENKKDHAEVGMVDDEDSENDEGLLVLRLRNSLAKLVGLSYEQFLEVCPGLVYSDEQEEFASSVQISAGRVASDLRTLFPKDWSTAKDSTLRALALNNDSQLIGGFVRYMQSREGDFEDSDKSPREEADLVKELILPVARSLVANWTDGNRKEAGVVLSHLTGSGKLVGQTVHAMARLLKKIHPVRFLESQMAALRMAFQTWIDGEPEEPPEDGPSEQQLLEYEQAEKDQQDMFLAAEHLASRLSMSLGVSKITDARLSQALLNFMQEGMRFAFEGDQNAEDDLVLGSRLPFLMLLIKYSSWIKKSRNQREIIADALFEKETALRSHREFDEVHEDDLRCIADFKESLAIPSSRRRAPPSQTEDDMSVGPMGASTVDTPASQTASASSRHRIPSTAGSQRSRMSVQSNLSPLMESPEDREDQMDDESPSPQKKRRLASFLRGRKESRIEEENSGSDGSDF